jgi:hypothetical protein
MRWKSSIRPMTEIRFEAAYRRITPLPVSPAAAANFPVNNS